MKQFFGCLTASIIFYFIASMVASSFNVKNWNDEGRMYFGLFECFIWIIPMILNWLSLKPNFED